MAKKHRASLSFHKNGQEWIKIPGPTQTFQIPVSTKAKYLGVVVSYTDKMPEQTVQHRTQVAQIAFSRLSRWLTGRRGLNASDRFQLWKSCVFSVLTYGIYPVGLTARCIHNLQRTIYRMLRKIFHCHAYHTRLTHAEVLQKFHTPSPVDLLWTAADVLHKSVSKRCLVLAPDDIVCTLDWSQLTSVKQILLAHADSGVYPSAFEPVPEVMASNLFCEKCGFVASNVSALRRHYTQEHKQSVYRIHNVHLADSMQDGLPACKHCAKTFTTWRSFVTHVQRGCQVTHQDPARRVCRVVQPERSMPTFPQQPPKVEAVIRGAAMLTATDLQNIHQHEWGRRLLVIIGHRHWQHLRLEEAANDYLAKRCCLCDQWVGRAQEMHKHMRLFHAEHWPNVMTRSTQLSNLYANEAPCGYCKCIFKSGHSCNVWTQVALLLLGGAGITEHVQSEPSASLVCEICNLEMLTLEDKHRHLLQEHQLTHAAWNVSRDAKDGTPTCTHCHAVFGSMASLRSHIVQGRCPGYDALQPTETLPVQDVWKKAMCEGELLFTLRDPQVRQALTLRCQNCPQRYSRAGDLALHLQSSHSALWTASEPLTMILVDLYYQQTGCVCNPSISTNRINHVCLPWRQLAIQHCRLGPDALFMPESLQESELSKVYHVDLPRQMKFEVDKLISERLFSSLWTRQDLPDFLRTTCLQCAGFFHPAELALHIREAHDSHTSLVQYYINALTPWLQASNDVDYHCVACGLIYNLPAASEEAQNSQPRRRLVQAHCRAQCPVLLQAALVLSRVADGGRPRDAGQCGSLSTSVRGLSSNGSILGWRPETDGKSGTTEAAKNRRRKQTSQRSSPADGHGQGLVPYGQASAQAGPGDSVNQTRGHLPALFQQQRKDRSLAADGADSGSLAQPSAAGPGQEACDAAATEAPASADARAAPTATPTGRSEPTIGIVQGCHAEWNPPARYDLSISGVGPDSKETQDQPKTTFDTQEDGGQCPGIPGDVLSIGPHHEVPLLAASRSCDALETPAESPGGQGISADASVLSVEHMAPLGSDGQSAQPLPERTCISVGSDDGDATKQGREQRQRKRKEQADATRGDMTELNRMDRVALQQTVAIMVLVNPNNWCFANASLFSMLWSTLSLRQFEPETWGSQCHHLCDFLDRMTRARGNLSQERWFTEMLRCWGRNELAQSQGSIAQHDAAEFVSFWLEYMATPAFEMQWERRVSENGTVHMVDQCIGNTPLFFQFAPIDQHASTIDLTTLARRWSQVDGMRAGLLNMSDCVCIHLDRCMQDNQGRVIKCASVLQSDTECLLPVLMGHSTECQYLEYQIVALMSHLGGDGSGHYRAALRVLPGVNDSAQPYRWLLTDDWSPATLVWSLPQWFTSNITLAWVIRSDRTELFDYSLVQLPSVVQHDPVAAMLELLASATVQIDTSSSATNLNTNEDQKTCEF